MLQKTLEIRSLLSVIHKTNHAEVIYDSTLKHNGEQHTSQEDI